MLIIWGTKRKDIELGWVADYCRTCGEPKAHRIREVLEVDHLYYISIGKGKTVGYEIACEQCQTTSQVEPSEYDDFADTPGADLGPLIEQTNPSLIGRLVHREAVVQRLEQGAATEADKYSLLHEALASINPELEARCAETHFDMRAGLCALAFLVVPVLAMLVGELLGKAYEKPFVYVALVLAVFIAGFLFYTLSSDGVRYARRALFPKLIPKLKKLKPSLDELDRVLAEAKQMDLMVGKKVKAQELYEAYTLDPAS